MRLEHIMLRVLTALILSTISLQAFAKDSCSADVKTTLAIKKFYGDYRLLTLNDLTADDRSLWRSRWGVACPGRVTLVQGHNEALLLIAPESKTFVLVRRDMQSRGGVSLTEIERGSYGFPPVIRKPNQQIISRLAKREIMENCLRPTIKNSVILEFIESTVSLYSSEKANCKLVISD